MVLSALLLGAAPSAWPECSLPTIDDVQVFSASTGGVNWNNSGVSLPNGRSVLRDASGDLHVIYIDDALGDGDATAVVEVKSSNGGVSWTTLVVSTYNTTFDGDGQQFVDPKLILASNGGLHALWVNQTFGVGDNGENFSELLHSSRSLTSSWGTPVAFATITAQGNPGPLAFSAVTDSSGTLRILYGNDLFDEGSGQRLWYVTISEAGVLSTPVNIRETPNAVSGPPVVAVIDSADRLHVILTSRVKRWLIFCGR